MRLFAAAALTILLTACGPGGGSGDGTKSGPSTPSSTASTDEMQARIALLPAPYDQANYDAGRRVFAQCRSCHTVAADGGHRVGPNLHGVFGREIGTAEGFTYSQVVQDADFVWDAEHLDQWLANPRDFLPGNRMSFAGVRDETQRRDVIAYLMAETDPEPETPPAP